MMRRHPHYLRVLSTKHSYVLIYASKCKRSLKIQSSGNFQILKASPPAKQIRVLKLAAISATQIQLLQPTSSADLLIIWNAWWPKITHLTTMTRMLRRPCRPHWLPRPRSVESLTAHSSVEVVAWPKAMTSIKSICSTQTPKAWLNIRLACLIVRSHSNACQVSPPTIAHSLNIK